MVVQVMEIHIKLCKSRGNAQLLCAKEMEMLWKFSGQKLWESWDMCKYARFVK